MQNFYLQGTGFLLLLHMRRSTASFSFMGPDPRVSFHYGWPCPHVQSPFGMVVVFPGTGRPSAVFGRKAPRQASLQDRHSCRKPELPCPRDCSGDMISTTRAACLGNRKKIQIKVCPVEKKLNDAAEAADPAIHMEGGRGWNKLIVRGVL